MPLIRERELTNKTTSERHEVKSKNFQEAVEQLEAPTSNENLLEFTPNTDTEKFLNELPK